MMKMPAPRTLLRLFIGLGVLGLLAWFTLQEPAQLAHVEQVRHGPITRQFSEEGKTRLKARYVLTAPVSGTLQRIALEPGDPVQAGQVLARITPATSALLDASGRARAQAEVQAGLAQQNAARERIRAARATWKLALASRDRARALRPSNVISQEALEQAEARARSSLADLKAAQADEAAAAQRVSAARAVLAQEGQAHRGDDEPGMGKPADSKHQTHAASGQPVGGGNSHGHDTGIRNDNAARQDGLVANGTNPSGDASRHPRNGIVTVPAPVSGVILKRDQQSEMPVTAGQRLMEIGDLTRLDIEADLLSTDAMTLKPGMRARVLRWGGEGVLDATISRIEPGGFTKVSALGVEEQRTRVLLDIASPREQWASLGDAYRVELEFIQQHLDDALQVPAGALFRLTGRQRQQLANENAGARDTNAPPSDEPQWAVYRVVDDRARLTPVRTGLRSGTAVQILQGLSNGDRVIIQPDDRIQDGTRIEAD